MYQIWVYDTITDEWVKVSGNIEKWDDALSWARNRALKDMTHNVSIYEFDEEDEITERYLLEELEVGK